MYALYLLYLGLPMLMESPTDKALGYTAVVVVVGIVVMLVVGAIAGAIVTVPAPEINLPTMSTP